MKFFLRETENCQLLSIQPWTTEIKSFFVTCEIIKLEFSKSEIYEKKTRIANF
jgi:hypothetical protein